MRPPRLNSKSVYYAENRGSGRRNVWLARFEHGESFAALAIEVKKHTAFGVGFVQRVPERLHIRNRFAVYFSNDVFALNVLGRSDAVVFHVGNDHALLRR